MLKEYDILFQLIFKVSKIFHSTPLQFSCHEFTIKVAEKSSPLFKSFCRKFICRFFLCLLAILQIAVAEIKSSANFFDRILYGITLMVLLPSHSILYTCDKQAQKICVLFNGILRFSANHKNQKSQKPKILVKLCISIAYILPLAAILSPFILVIGFHWQNPCKPSILGYWLLEQCSKVPTPIQESSYRALASVITKVIVFGINTWTWLFGTVAVFVFIGGIQMICGVCILEFIEFYPNHATNQNLKLVQKCEIYRTIQVLINVLNDIQRIVLTFEVIPSTLFLSISTMGLLVFPWRNEYAMALSFMVIANLVCVTLLLVILGGFANLELESEQIPRRVFTLFNKRILTGQRQKVREIRVLCRSCVRTSVKFGYMNWVEKLTSLKCIDFANELTAQCLLLRRN